MRPFQARISSLERGLVEISATNHPDLEQQDGHVHAGALATSADSAGGYAALSLLPSGSRVLTVEVKLNFLRPSVGKHDLWKRQGPGDWRYDRGVRA